MTLLLVESQYCTKHLLLRDYIQPMLKQLFELPQELCKDLPLKLNLVLPAPILYMLSA